MLGLGCLNAIVVLGLFSSPMSSPWVYCFWPPIAALENLKVAASFVVPELAPKDTETALVRPLVWIATSPALVVSMWALLDLRLLLQMPKKREL
jgi:hypothetical protein